jgi:hypothetical protein
MARVRNVDAVRGQETNQKTMNYRGKENHGEDWVANAHFGGDAATRTVVSTKFSSNVVVVQASSD